MGTTFLESIKNDDVLQSLIQRLINHQDKQSQQIEVLQVQVKDLTGEISRLKHIDEENRQLHEKYNALEETVEQVF